MTEPKTVTGLASYVIADLREKIAAMQTAIDGYNLPLRTKRKMTEQIADHEATITRLEQFFSKRH